ncbi:MAG TPA: carbamate kinase [Phototrophicaceae bacterium]|nr:carbamate kinase [Phototrophicaceae bacterium]
MVGKLAAVAIGGNSLIQDPKQPDVQHQWEAVRVTCEHIASMIAEGWSVIITHGNGPQVGFILRRAELASKEVHPVPLDLIVADTQGSIGYMLQQSLDNALRRLGINRTIVTMVTQVRVDAHDPAFQNASKPIGGFMTEPEARRYEAEGWKVVEDAGRGWRRVVASPKPLTIQEINAIRALIMNDYIVIAVGGGGIPVIRDAQGNLKGANAVIDKDRASSLLAQMLRADLFVISTGVEQVALNFNKPDQKMLAQMTLAEAEQYIGEGHFAAGSMLPKIEAAVEFVRMGGPQAIITDPPNLARALRGDAGTRIVPG